MENANKKYSENVVISLLCTYEAMLIGDTSASLSAEKMSTMMDRAENFLSDMQPMILILEKLEDDNA